MQVPRFFKQKYQTAKYCACHLVICILTYLQLIDLNECMSIKGVMYNEKSPAH